MISTEETENNGKHETTGFQDGSTNPMMDSSLSNIVRYKAYNILEIIYHLMQGSKVFLSSYFEII